MSNPESVEDFVSELSTGHERMLARLLVHSIAEGYRTAEDFLERFGPDEIMQSLEDAPDLRAQILTEAAGVHERIARKKSTSSAAEDLRIALDEGICEAETILTLFPPDDRVRYLDNAALWSFVNEDEFWTGVTGAAQGVSRMVFTLEAALSEDLITLQDITDGATFEEIAKRLPRDDVEALLVQAFTLGRDSTPITEDHLIDTMSLETLLSHLSLESIWEQVVINKVAEPAGFLEEGSAPIKSGAKQEPKRSVPPPMPKKDKGRRRNKKAATQAARPQKSEPRAPAPAKPPADEDLDVDVDQLVNSSRTPQEEEAREKVVGRLRQIERLPPKYDSLPTGMLLSLESMYAELFQVTTDEEREECIHDSFPNETQLTTAMLALIELLDPSIDITDPVIRDADVASLIKVVLFEERHRAEQSNPSQTGTSAPPAQSRQQTASGPPPLPGAGAQKSTPPPLPPPARVPRAR
jgi:hypothetical protein